LAAASGIHHRDKGRLSAKSYLWRAKPKGKIVVGFETLKACGPHFGINPIEQILAAHEVTNFCSNGGLEAPEFSIVSKYQWRQAGFLSCLFSNRFHLA